MAAVRANTMQTITKRRILGDGHPFAASHEQRSKSKWERENRMRETNQPKKPANWSVFSLFHNSR